MSAKPRASCNRLAPGNRRAALIEAALHCIAEGGIAAFMVDQICANAGVSRGLVIYHFGSMNALLAAVYGCIYATSVPVPEDMPRYQPQILSLLDPLADLAS